MRDNGTYIHIPSDAPGFLIAQRLVTSGLVPRSVSQEHHILLFVEIRLKSGH
ncbi:MAG: hypothetical protein LBF66_02855 [Holosporales bacterium]|nr:hypothetical protein [Holosporales bacterium]